MTIWNIFIIAMHAIGASETLPVGEGVVPEVIAVQQLEAPKGAIRLQLRNIDRQEGLAQVTVFDESYTPLRMIPVALDGQESLHTIVLQTLDKKTACYFQVTSGNQTSAITEIK
ncbi:hypothetical protein [uncultured Chitinophaga sp.]|uniref:hypothetical protein n=1 Tax=uncultured Chitinophaga sp. TaxID=339340 RepID=UPI0025F04689|nr:hypothetical protein [uncultured Chitinophaga sp.]